MSKGWAAIFVVTLWLMFAGAQAADGHGSFTANLVVGAIVMAGMSLLMWLAFKAFP